VWEPKLWYHPVTPRFHGYGDVTATYIRRSELPSHIYAKHKSTTRNQSTHEAWYSYICQHKKYTYKVITGYYKVLHITCVLHHNQVQKRNIQDIHKSSRVGWRSRESKEEPGTKEEELACLLTRGSSIYSGWLHYDPSFEIWICKSKGSRHIIVNNYSQVATRHE